MSRAEPSQAEPSRGQASPSQDGTANDLYNQVPFSFQFVVTLRFTKRLPPKSYLEKDGPIFEKSLGANDSKQLWEQIASVHFPEGTFCFTTFSKSWKKLTPFPDPLKSTKSRIEESNPINRFREK